MSEPAPRPGTLAGLLRSHPLKVSSEGQSKHSRPDQAANTILSLLRTLEDSQWWPAERLQAHQHWRRDSLLAHCHAQVPHYRKQLDAVGYRPGEPITDEQWQQLPRLDRRTVQRAPGALRGQRYPKSHGQTLVRSTSGSSGTPIKVLTTELTNSFWDALAVRSLIWADMDPAGKLAAVRGRLKNAPYPEGARQATWGAPIDQLFETGPAVALTGTTPLPQVVEWLSRQTPDYLVGASHTISALARHCRRTGQDLPNLKVVQSYGGVIRTADHALCKAAWGAELHDTYSTEEVGYIALPCPEEGRLHVQSETVLLEILDPEGRPCPPGQQGRVFVTPLYSYAMPLLRYDLGDLAIPGDPCACGRGQPVIGEVVGRARDLLTLPDGTLLSPGFMNGLFAELPVVQYQLVQDAPDHIEARIVPAEDYQPGHEAQVHEDLLGRLPGRFNVTVTCVEDIARTEGGKYLDFKSALTISD